MQNSNRIRRIQAVFIEFKRKCMKWLTDTANKAAKRPTDHLPNWLSPEAHSAFPEARSHPTFEKISISGKANMRKLGYGVGTHYKAEELGRVSTLSEVYLRSRSKKPSKDSGEVWFIDDRCSQSWTCTLKLFLNVSRNVTSSMS
ncbi:hypothetical protein AKJ16_DCAP18302 [Drosera capensis]